MQEKEKDRTLELIKQQYLGAEKQKKKVMRPTEKFRFNFDWEAAEDTSRDLNPLTKETTEAALLFGRGMRAGVDRREQKKAAAMHEQEILRKMRETAVRCCLTAPQFRCAASCLLPNFRALEASVMRAPVYHSVSTRRTCLPGYRAGR